MLRYCINEKDRGNKKRKEFLTFSVYIQINNCEKAMQKQKRKRRNVKKLKHNKKKTEWNLIYVIKFSVFCLLKQVETKKPDNESEKQKYYGKYNIVVLYYKRKSGVLVIHAIYRMEVGN